MWQLDLMIFGRVQGVGFRFFVERHARRLGVTGVVRNLPNGTVQVVAQGAKEQLAPLLGNCRRGPFLANVKNVEERWSELAALTYSNFSVE